MIKNWIYKDYKKDVQTLERMYRQFLEGEIFESEFKNFRLVNGIYGQRQKEFFMVRIKVPAGVLTAEQLKKISVLADKYSNGVVHFTTRQDAQLHWVDIKNVPQLIEEINAIGLTTKDACGNTLRNITATFLSGVCPYEPFEVQRVAQKLTELYLGKFENLPRKFKISFSCCEHHSYLIPFNDIGLIPRLREGKPGFSVFIGGGLGDRPKQAVKFTEFLPLEHLTPFVSSILQLFDEMGDRENRRHNRLKFLIQKTGKEKFLRILEDRFRQNLERIGLFECDVPVEQPLPAENPVPDSDKPQYSLWLKTNVIPQKQKGMFTVLVKLPLGNIPSGKLRKLSDIAQEFMLPIKATYDQNIALLNVHIETLYSLYKALEETKLADFGASTYLDITACPGSETCSLGITSSRDLARVIMEKLPKGKKEVEKLKDITIKVSGCPNGCAHHHVASIGLHGIAMKVNGNLIPAYVLHLGGNGNLPQPRIGHTGIKIPARNVPDAVVYLLKYYLENSTDGESFNSFVDRVGVETLNKLVEKFQKLYREKEEYSIDWGSDKKFSLEDIGTGECAGIIADRVEQALREGERLLKQAKTHIQKGYPEDAVPHIEKAVDIIASGLLIPFGVKATGQQAREKFIEHIIGRKLVDEGFIPLLTEKIGDIKYLLETGEEFYNASKKAYLKLKRETEEKKSAGKEADKSRKEFLDLRGVECPFNYVKAKYKLREMETGGILVITLDGGESIRSVPQSLRDDGHEIIDIQEEKDGSYVVVVRKR